MSLLNCVALPLEFSIQHAQYTPLNGSKCSWVLLATWSGVQKNQRIPKNIFFSLGIPSGVQTGGNLLTVCNRVTALVGGHQKLLIA